ncbi:MAG: hypothetical protein GXP25_00070 [Planctomycetes bacterium]|nr:hypothetical protein [Planctomycetota bacterium]
MRNRVILVALCMLVFTLFSCEEKKEAKQEKVTKKAAPPAAKQPPAMAEAKKPTEKKPAAVKKTGERKKAGEVAAREKATKEAEARKAAEEKARKEAEAQKTAERVAKEKARKKAEAKKAAKRAAREKVHREAAAKRAAERAERKRKKHEAEFGRFTELGITVKPKVEKVALELLGRPVTFRGVEVVAVKPGGIADKAGVKKGDMIQGICNRPICHLSNVVDGMLRAVPVTDRLAEKKWTVAVAEGDAMTRVPRFTIVRDGVQKDLAFSIETFRLNRQNYAMAVAEYENPLAERKDVLGGAIFCEKRARHFKEVAFFGPLFDVKAYDNWKHVRLLIFLTWREGKVGDVAF